MSKVKNTQDLEASKDTNITKFNPLVASILLSARIGAIENILIKAGVTTKEELSEAMDNLIDNVDKNFAKILKKEQ